MKNLGIFVNRNHTNFTSYIAFWTSSILEENNIFLQVYDDNTRFKDIVIYDVNIFLNRYCFFDPKSLLENDDYTKNTYLVHSELTNPIIVCPKSATIGWNRDEFLSSFCKVLQGLDLQKCYLSNIGYINSILSQSVFICYDDFSLDFMSFLNEFFYKEKPVFFNGKLYTIDPKKHLFKYKNTDVAKINNQTYVVWHSKTQQWKKFKKGDKVLC